MVNYTYKQILEKAKTVQNNVKKEYNLGVDSKWSYYFAKAILTPKKDIKKININDAPNPSGTGISRQLTKAQYKDIAKDYVEFIEKEHRLPNFSVFGKYHIIPKLLTEVFSRILVFYDNEKRLPNQVNINSKVFTKPVETGNAVYDYFTKKTGKSFKTLDDLLAYVKKYWHYQKYFDDKKSNIQVIDEKSGNCTDLLQFLMNYVSAMGYESKCIHVKCKSSGTGHVFGKFRHPKHTDGKWITRDIACVADGGSITCVWCSNGTLQATNPSWFMSNLHR